MKIVIARLLIAFVIFAGAALAFASEFKSKIITTQAVVIPVPDNHFLKITNFTQEGGTERAVVQVTLQGQDTETTGTANVLTATRVDLSTGANSQNFPEIGNSVIIAGPAQVKVRPVAGATLFISYRKESEDGGGGGGGGGRATPTPFPIFPTPTPTPTVSAG
jgi:hypothetical protein